MKKSKYYIVTICTLVLTLYYGLASAATTTLSEVDRGWYDSTGYHLTGNTNYYVGEGSIYEEPTAGEYRNWFVFDLSGISDTILSATLRLENTSYDSPDSTETYTLFDITTSLSSLTGGSGGVSAFNDLGGGTSYGFQTVSSADDFSLVDISLNVSVKLNPPGQDIRTRRL